MVATVVNQSGSFARIEISPGSSKGRRVYLCISAGKGGSGWRCFAELLESFVDGTRRALQPVLVSTNWSIPALSGDLRSFANIVRYGGHDTSAGGGEESGSKVMISNVLGADSNCWASLPYKLKLVQDWVGMEWEELGSVMEDHMWWGWSGKNWTQ